MSDSDDMTALVPARCCETDQPYFNEFEYRSAGWTAVRTTVPEVGTAGGSSVNEREATLQGPFEFLPQYDGCPHCPNTGLFQCGHCEELACWNVSKSLVTCPHCGAETNIEGDFESMDAQEKRPETGARDQAEPDRLGRRE